MTKIRNLLLTVATSAACVALVSDVHGMRSLQQKLQAVNARAPVVAAANQEALDIQRRIPVALPLMDGLDAAHGDRLGGGTAAVLSAKRAFHDGLVGVAAALLDSMQGSLHPLATGAAVEDGDVIVGAGESAALRDLIVALEQTAHSSMDGAGARLAGGGRTLDASYADFVALLEHAGAGRRDALLDHILDAGTTIETYITDFDGQGAAHAGFANIRATLGGSAARHDADFGVDRIARWHLGRLVLAEHAATGLTFKAIRALAKIFGGL